MSLLMALPWAISGNYSLHPQVRWVRVFWLVR